MRSSQVLEFQAESLESREMLAGNVSVEVRGDDLSIRGDSASNTLYVYYSANGVYVSPGAGTTVNGRPYGLTLNFSDDLRIDMGDGNDDLIFGSLSNSAITVADDLKIKMGRGRDALSITNTVVEDDLSIDMGSGSVDFVTINKVTVRDDLTVKASGSQTRMDFYFSSVTDDLKITGTQGDDSIQVRSVNVYDDLTISSRGGADNIYVGRHVSTSPPGVVRDDLKIQSGSGDDTVTLYQLYVADRTSISTQSGNDQFRWTGNLSRAYGNVSISMGSGYDSGLMNFPISSSVEVRWSGREA